MIRGTLGIGKEGSVVYEGAATRPDPWSLCTLVPHGGYPYAGTAAPGNLRIGDLSTPVPQQHEGRCTTVKHRRPSLPSVVAPCAIWIF